MANVIKLKNSGTAAAVPTSLEYGELGFNYADGKIFYKNALGNIAEFTVNAGNINAHESVKLATTTALPNSPSYSAGSADGNGGYGVGAYLQGTAYAALSIDSVAVAVNDRILVKNQTNELHNGIYIVTTVGSGSTYWRLTRSLDFDNSSGPEVTSGDYVYSTLGTTNTGKAWMMNSVGTNTDKSIKIGTDNIVWVGVGTGPTGATGATGAGGVITNYGSFYSNSDQSATTGGEAVRFGQINVSYGVTCVTNGTHITRVTIPVTGAYIIDFAGQLASTGGEAQQVNFWLVKNGVTAVSTAFDSTVRDATPVITSWAWQVEASAGDYYEVFWNATSTNVYLNYAAAVSPVPAAAAAFVRITQMAYQGIPGPVVPLDDLTNVTAPSPTSGDFLKWNGTAWVNDAIDLGTDTTGNYMSNVSAGTGITVTHTPGEGSTATIAVTANTYQPLDADLTAIAALSGTSGVLKKTAADTWALDTATYLTSASTLLMDIQVMQAMEAY
jgi:hypothetical protein